MCGERAAELLEEPGVGLIGLTETGQDDAAERQLRGRYDRQQLAFLAAEPGRSGERARDRATRCLVKPSGGRRHNALLPDPDNGSAGAGQVGLGKANFHRRPQLVVVAAGGRPRHG